MPIARRLTHLLKVLAIFAILGPPIGAVTFFAGIGAYGTSQTGDPASLMWVFLFGAIYAVPLSYLIGIMPAAIAGLILGGLAIFHRAPGLHTSAVIGLLIGIGLVYSGGRPTMQDTAESASEYAPALILISTCLIATVLCWAVARRTLTSASPPPTKVSPRVEE